MQPQNFEVALTISGSKVCPQVIKAKTTVLLRWKEFYFATSKQVRGEDKLPTSLSGWSQKFQDRKLFKYLKKEIEQVGKVLKKEDNEEVERQLHPCSLKGLY